MTYDHFIDALRLLDAILASLVFGILVYRGRLFFQAYTKPQKWLYISFTMYALAAAYTSFELYGQDVENGLRSWFLLAANITALYALARNRNSIIVGGGNPADDKYGDTPR